MSSNSLDSIRKEIDRLHDALEHKGINTRGTTDVYGRPFVLPVRSPATTPIASAQTALHRTLAQNLATLQRPKPLTPLPRPCAQVDEEHKATVFGMSIIAQGPKQPHLRAFWAATFGFFSCFFSVFAPAALIPYMKRSVAEGGIALSKIDIDNAGAVGLSSTIIMRIFTGALCDVFGARKTFVFLLLMACPGIIALIFIQDGAGLIAARFFIGIGLATFVTCQVWCSQMFNKSIVGVANATAGGWGNLGGGVTQLVMPAIMGGMLTATGNNVNLSWRVCFAIPLGMHIISAMFVITGRDLPDGNYAELEKKGVKAKSRGATTAKIGVSNVNAWILSITYGLCFGIELCMNNKVVPYFHRYYAMNPFISGVLGSCFGLMNIFARSWGGLLSDAMNARFGMRGRLWAMWVVQTLEGVACICMGLVTLNYPNPDDYTTKVEGTWSSGGRAAELYTFNHSAAMVGKCGSKEIATPTHGWTDFGTADAAYTEMPATLGDAFIMIKDPWDECIHNAAPLGLTMLVMICFSLCVQMAEGLHFGVVPYVSRPALGIVSGMVGAGGNFGGVMGTKFIVSALAPLDDGFINLGIVIITMSLVMFGLYFPEHGGMLFKPGALGSYDPQLIKPPADLKGADQLNYGKTTSSSTTTNSTSKATV